MKSIILDPRRLSQYIGSKDSKRSGTNVASLACQILVVFTQQNTSPSLRNRSSKSDPILNLKVRSIKGKGWIELQKSLISISQSNRKKKHLQIHLCNIKYINMI